MTNTQKTRTSGRILASLFVATVLLASMPALVSALGVALPYSRDIALELSPGQSQEVKINLQNGLSDSATNVVLSIVSGGEIASLDETEYTLEAGSLDNFAIMNVEIPSDAQVGTEYLVTFGVATADRQESGQMVSLGTSVTISFPVKVVEAKPIAVDQQQAAPQPSLVVFVLVVIAVLVALWMILKNLRKKKK